MRSRARPINVAALADFLAALDVNPYEVLEIPLDASPDMIKKAYHRIVFECHPDRNPDPTCEERFKIATAAYEVLTARSSRQTTPPQWEVPHQYQATRVGPYVNVSFDRQTTKTIGGKPYRFRIIVYGAYDAFGLIGSEDNGVAILDEERRQVLCDRIEPQSTGYFGPSPTQFATAAWLVDASSENFVAFVNSNPRTRYQLDLPQRPRSRGAPKFDYVPGVPIDGYRGNKDRFLKSALRLAMAVGRALKPVGFMAKSHINEAGPAVSGEVYAYYVKGDVTVLVTYGTALAATPEILMQIRHEGHLRGANHYVDPDSSVAQIAAEVQKMYVRYMAMEP